MSYLFRYGVDGVDLNTDATPDEPFVDITTVEGLDSAPVRTTEREREGMDGGFVDAEFEGMRTIILEGLVYGNDPGILEAYLDDLKANYAPVHDARPFYFTLPGVGQRLVFCKSYGCKYNVDQARRTGSSPIQFQLIGLDPRIYGVSLIQQQTSLSEEVGGRGYDKSYDYGYGGPVQGGQVTINNLGNRDTDAIITINGPVTNPVIVHDVSNRRLSFNIVLSAVEHLVIDTYNKTVLLNGTANRRGALNVTSRWFRLEPGPNSLRFQGTRHIPVPEPTMLVEARSAYR